MAQAAFGGVSVLQGIGKRPGLAAKKDERMQPMSNVLRMRFDSRGMYADFALARLESEPA